MKSIRCRAYNAKEKKWYWFDVLWGDEHGAMWVLPDGEKRAERTGGINGKDNRIRIDPLGWKIYVELSPYMPSHLDLGNEECCGIFNGINDNGIVECNECAMTINKAIELLKLKPGDTVKVCSALKGAPNNFYKIQLGKNGALILNDAIGTKLSELNPGAIQKTYNDCPKCNGSGIDAKQTVVAGYKVLCAKCEGKNV